MNKTITSAAIALTISATGALAATFDGLIDFSGFNNNDSITQIDLGGGVLADLQVVNGSGSSAFAGEARIFDTTPGGPAVNNVNDPDLVADPFANSAGGTGRSFGNALIIQERASVSAPSGPDDERRGGVIFFDFGTTRIDLLSLFYLDGEEGFSVEANMAELGRGNGTDDQFTLLDFSSNADAKGISRFAVVFNGSGAIGEIEVGLSAVPVPAGLPLLLTAFGAFAVLRRKRKAT